MPPAMNAEPRLTSWLAAAFEQCAERCPTFSQHLGDFAAALGDRFTEGAEARAAVPSHAVGDLFVAWATARAIPEAVAQFERDYLAPACSSVRSADTAELAQLVRVRLLVADGQAPPRLSRYSGKGPLLAWVRMTATRVAIDLARKLGTERRAAEELSHASTPFDPELDYLKARYAEPFRNALERALRSLSERDATLIKLSYLDDISPSAMARTYGVSTRTVQRWIVDARTAVLEGARRILADELHVDPAELDGLMRLAQSQLKVTLERVLGDRLNQRSGRDS
jgi:RNA polymerase sigma-70 factor (ECF subfamily)